MTGTFSDTTETLRLPDIETSTMADATRLVAKFPRAILSWDITLDGKPGRVIGFDDLDAMIQLDGEDGLTRLPMWSCALWVKGVLNGPRLHLRDKFSLGDDSDLGDTTDVIENIRPDPICLRLFDRAKDEGLIPRRWRMQGAGARFPRRTKSMFS